MDRPSIDERLAALEAELGRAYRAIASLERGVARHKPIALRRPENADLRAIVEAVGVDPATPYTMPRNLSAA